MMMTTTTTTMTTTTRTPSGLPRNEPLAGEQWRPVAYVATEQDPPLHARLVDALERSGWAAISQPTGFHLIQAIAGVIDGRSWLRPGLLVIDARLRGCSGTTIAAGLRELGIEIPTVLIADPGETLPVAADAMLRIVEPARAIAVVRELARRLATSPPPTPRAGGRSGAALTST
jgi:DNA-binding response OmpR family regulator